MSIIPNLLTIFRMISPLPILFAMYFMSHPVGLYVAFGIFLIAALTDYFDGFIARAFKAESAIGRILDPISDKMLVLTVGFILVVGHTSSIGFPDLLLILPFTMIMLRELFVSGLLQGLSGKVEMRVSWVGKVKTTVQFVGICLLFLVPIFGFQVANLTEGMDEEIAMGIIAGNLEDEIGLRSTYRIATISQIALNPVFWLAAILSWISGYQYLRTAIRSKFGTVS